jgi:hypothetical protein
MLKNIFSTLQPTQNNLQKAVNFNPETDSEYLLGCYGYAKQQIPRLNGRFRPSDNTSDKGIWSMEWHESFRTSAQIPKAYS